MTKQEFIDRVYECGRIFVEGLSAEERASVDAMFIGNKTELSIVGTAFSTSFMYEMTRTEEFRQRSSGEHL